MSFSEYTVLQKNIVNNLLQYKRIDNNSKICAVVKANAYGLGVDNVVPKIESLVDCFAVANFEEAMQLSKLTSKDIIILNFVPEQFISECAERKFQISVSSYSQLLKIKKYAKNHRMDIQLAVDTGMHRIGFESIFEFEKVTVVK